MSYILKRPTAFFWGYVKINKELIMKLIKLVFLSTLMAFASSAIAQNGATVIDNFGCWVVAADSGLPVSLFTEVSHSVTNSAVNTNLWCDFVFDPALCPDSKAMKHKNFDCGTLDGLATKTQATTDCEYGVVHLSCQIKANQ